MIAPTFSILCGRLRLSYLPLSLVLGLASVGCKDEGTDAPDGGNGAMGMVDARPADGPGAGSCPTGGGEASVGACLVARFAGTYTLMAAAGSHARGTLTIAPDGAVDYDTGNQLAIADHAGVYDRLMCCNRVSIEMKQRPDNDRAQAADARRRLDLFTASAAAGAPVVRFEYYPNYPSTQGKVDLQVVR
jgi:hypothetical protein